MNRSFAVLLSLVFVVSVFAQTPDLSSLEKSDSGRRALAYFAAFNSGEDSKLTAFFSEHTDSEALKRRGVEPRVAFHKQVRSDFKHLDVKKVVSLTTEEINVLAQSPSGEWASVTFEIEGAAGKFAGVRVERVPPPATQPETKPPTNMADFLTATDQLLTGLSSSDAFSGTVLIAKDNKPIFLKAYGLTDPVKKIANKPDTKFNLGSICKTFTSIAIGQLIKQGKLSLDDKLIKILPDYPNKDAAAKITVGQLMNMTSGIGDFFNPKFEAADKLKIRSLKDYLPLFGTDPLEFEPGTSSRYSNGGYLVLGLIIERITGKSYYDYVNENIFKPAGMADSGFYEIDKLPANTALGLLRNTGVSRATNESMQPARGSSAGGGYSTVEDLLKFSNALRNKKLEIPDDKGAFPAQFERIGIAGGSPGVNALFIANGQTGYTIIVLSNFGPPSAEKPGTLIRDWLKQLQQ